MNVADSYSIKICAYKNYLICTLNDTPKLMVYEKYSSLFNFNKKDLLISPEALLIIKNAMLNVNNDELYGIRIINKNKIIIASTKNIIINKSDVQTFALPIHTVCENNVQEELKKEIDKL